MGLKHLWMKPCRVQLQGPSLSTLPPQTPFSAVCTDRLASCGLLPGSFLQCSFAPRPRPIGPGALRPDHGKRGGVAGPSSRSRSSAARGSSRGAGQSHGRHPPWHCRQNWPGSPRLALMTGFAHPRGAAPAPTQQSPMKTASLHCTHRQGSTVNPRFAKCICRAKPVVI